MSEEGEVHYYVLCVMQFGLTIAVYIVTWMLRSVKVFFQGLSIKYNLYIVNSQNHGGTKYLTEYQTSFCLTVLELLGWEINYGV